MAVLSLLGHDFGADTAYAAVDGVVFVLALLAAVASGRGRALARGYNRTAVACIVSAFAALASGHSSMDYASCLRLVALLALPLITRRRWGSVVAQLYCVLNVHRVVTAADGIPWMRVVLTLLYMMPMLACLGVEAHAALRTLANRALFVQEIQLIRLSRQRPLVVGDVWKLPERLSLHAIRREFKCNVEEPMFLLRAIVRMVWRPLLPLLSLRFLLEVSSIAEAMVTGYLLQCFDSTSDYPWYYGYGIALALCWKSAISSLT